MKNMGSYSDEEIFSDDFSDDDDDTEVAKEDKTDANPVTGLRHLIQMKETLGLDSFKEKKSKQRERKRRQKERKRLKKQAAQGQVGPTVHTLATKVAAKEGKTVKAPEVIVYQDPRKLSLKRKQQKAAEAVGIPSITEGGKTDESELSMKQARFEVFKFSLSGMDKSDKEDARIAHAIRLGAKAPKNPCLPYDELKAKRSSEREEELRQKEMQRFTGMRVSSSRPASSKGLTSSAAAKGQGSKVKKGKKKPTKGKEQSIALKLGKFDGGMLKLSSKDLAKMKSS